MQRFSLPLYALLAALGLAGCQAKDAPVAAGASVGAVTPVNAAQERRPDLELREKIMYPLEMNKVRAMASITKEMATKEFTAAAEKGQAANEPPADQMSNDNSVAESIAYANGNPAAREVIRKNGMTARDFIMTGYALIHARALVDLWSANPNSIPPDQYSPANMKFVNDNKAELDKMMKDAGMMRK